MLFYNSTSFATEALKQHLYIIIAADPYKRLGGFLTLSGITAFRPFHHISFATAGL